MFNNQITYYNKDFRIQRVTLDSADKDKDKGKDSNITINVNLELGKLRN